MLSSFLCNHSGNMSICGGGSSRAQLAAESSPGCYRGTPQICHELNGLNGSEHDWTMIHDSL